MDSSRISFGEMIAAIAAGALFVFMFVPWYGASASLNGGKVNGVKANAWQAFSIIDILLFLVVAVTLGLVLARAAGKIPAELPAPAGLIVAVAGALAVLLILFRILNTPGEDVIGFGAQVEVGRKIGVFLGLLAAAAITFGGYTAMNERKDKKVEKDETDEKDDKDDKDDEDDEDEKVSS